ncbi:MAG: type II toxin-antitoxin system VapC family toxin [Dongiaceae bacterium]
MPRYLLDANAVSDLINDPHGRVAGAIERIGESSICTSIIVAAELHFGGVKKTSRRLMTQIETALAHLDIQPFAVPADRVYGDLRADLERKGRPIGPNDLLIAAHVLALGCTLVTDNEREFSRVKALQVENWL